MNIEDKVSMDSVPPSGHLCYVRCNFCNTVLAIGIPFKRLLDTVIVKCGHCSNLSFISTRPPVQGQCPDYSLSLQIWIHEEKQHGVHFKNTWSWQVQDQFNMKSESTTANAIHVPSPGRRKGRYQASKSPLPWQDKIFNASEQEDPSGPNPISNR